MTAAVALCWCGRRLSKGGGPGCKKHGKPGDVSPRADKRFERRPLK